MKDRILQIMKNKGMSQQEFSRATGISPASLSSIFNGRTAPTMKHAEAMHRHFPQLSMTWLLFGEGEMFDNVGEDDAVQSTLQRDEHLEPDVSNHVPGISYAADETQQSAFKVANGEPRSIVHQEEEFLRQSYTQNSRLRDANLYPPNYAGLGEIVNFPDRKQRKIVEIRIFFDDGTFETFKGNE